MIDNENPTNLVGFVDAFDCVAAHDNVDVKGWGILQYIAIECSIGG